MMTRPYLLSTTLSRSSMGGLMMPSTAGVPATLCLSELLRGGSRRLTALVAARGQHQGYQPMTDFLDGRVNQRDIELGLGGQLDPRDLQPPADDVGGFRAPACEPADQLCPRRRVVKNQQGPRNPLAPLPVSPQDGIKQSKYAFAKP